MAFVTFPLFHDCGSTSRLNPEGDRAVTIIWACWALPLLATEAILELRRLRALKARSR